MTQSILQGLAFDEFERQETHTVIFVEFMDSRDVWMVE
jgi:hypothetical protein